MIRYLLCVKGIAQESLNRLLLLLTLKKQPPVVFCEEKFSSKSSRFHRLIPALESLFNKVTGHRA